MLGLVALGAFAIASEFIDNWYVDKNYSEGHISVLIEDDDDSGIFLHMGCLNNNIKISINWDFPVFYEKTVSLKFDDDEPIFKDWPISGESTYFLGDPKWFLKEVRESNKLFAMLHGEYYSPTAWFNLGSTSNMLSEFRQICPAADTSGYVSSNSYSRPPTQSTPTYTPAPSQSTPSQSAPTKVSPSSSTTLYALQGPATIASIINGNTLELDINGEVKQVRLIGIDIPKSKSDSTSALSYLQNLLSGQQVWIEHDRQASDDEGRSLAYVYIRDSGGKWKLGMEKLSQVNELVAISGWANVLTVPPNERYTPLYIDAVQIAKSAKLGMWAK